MHEHRQWLWLTLGLSVALDFLEIVLRHRSVEILLICTLASGGLLYSFHADWAKLTALVVMVGGVIVLSRSRWTQ